MILQNTTKEVKPEWNGNKQQKKRGKLIKFRNREEGKSDNEVSLKDT